MRRFYLVTAAEYLYEMVPNFFQENKYIEGSYNDNRLVELFYQYYKSCCVGTYETEDDIDWVGFDHQDFDSRDFELLVDGYLDDEVGIKIQHYADDAFGKQFEYDDESFAKLQKQYIDWALSSESEECWCQKYIDIVNGAYTLKPPFNKWLNNEVRPDYDYHRALKEQDDHRNVSQKSSDVEYDIPDISETSVSLDDFFPKNADDKE